MSLSWRKKTFDFAWKCRYPFVTSQMSNFPEVCPFYLGHKLFHWQQCVWTSVGEVEIRSSDDTSSSQGSEVTHFFPVSQDADSLQWLQNKTGCHNSLHTLGRVLTAFTGGPLTSFWTCVEVNVINCHRFNTASTQDGQVHNESGAKEHWCISNKRYNPQKADQMVLLLFRCNFTFSLSAPRLFGLTSSLSPTLELSAQRNWFFLHQNKRISRPFGA